MTSFDSALKEYYRPGRVLNMVYDDNPFMALVPKDESFVGKTAPHPLIYGNPQGRSATFAKAQTKGQTSNSKLEDFILVRKKDYAVATIDNETLEASESDAGAFIKAAKTEINGAIQSISNSVAVSLFRNGTGSIGQIGALPGGNVVTLAETGDITNFEVDMALEVWSLETGGVQRTNVATITAVNRDTGQFTMDLTPTGSAPNDFIFVDGDRGLKLTGLDGWIPTVTPTSTPFFGVDRTVDPTRLAGIRYDGSAQAIEEALIDGAARIAREGGKGARLDYCFISHLKYADLEKSLGSKVQYVDIMHEEAQIGFRGIQLSGPKGMIKVLPDRSMFEDRAYLLTMSTWALRSLKKAVRVIDTDGLTMLRQSNADGVEIRYGSYSQLACDGPGYNGVVLL